MKIPSEVLRVPGVENATAARLSTDWPGTVLNLLGICAVFLRIAALVMGRHNGAMGTAGGVEDFDPKGGAAERAPRRIRVVLGDDHPALLEEVRYLLAPEFDVVGSAPEGVALVQAAFEQRPDAVISDIGMPRLNGIEAARQILKEQLCKAVIALTMHREPQFVDSALQAGIRGYVLKIEASEELVPALRTVLDGGIYLSRGVRK